MNFRQYLLGLLTLTSLCTRQFADASSFPKCKPGLPVATVCEQRLDALLPTQPDVGRYEVKIKQKKYSKLGATDMEKLKVKKPAPVVIGPDGNYYLIDHHHTALALEESGQTSMYVTIQEDWSNVGSKKKPIENRMRTFWNKMKSHKFGYFRNAEGILVDPLSASFPKTFEDMGNNRLRSVVYLLIDKDVIEMSDVEAAEFGAAEILRKMHVEVKKGNYDEAVTEAAEKLLARKVKIDARKAAHPGINCNRDAFKVIISPPQT